LSSFKTEGDDIFCYTAKFTVAAKVRFQDLMLAMGIELRTGQHSIRLLRRVPSKRSERVAAVG